MVPSASKRLCSLADPEGFQRDHGDARGGGEARAPGWEWVGSMGIVVHLVE